MLAPPPPRRPPNPIFYNMAEGSTLIRLFDPTSYNATATSFRYYGPKVRFDHHRGQGTNCDPCPDPKRGIYYAAPTLSSCIVEIFGDTGVIQYGEWHVAIAQLTRDIVLLDLRGKGAMRAGSTAKLAKVAERPPTQEWSRHFYDNPDDYRRTSHREIDGLIYYNSHNDEDAIALYERAEDAIHCPTGNVIRLDTPDPNFQAYIQQIAEDNHLVIEDVGH